jgi:hypothetical protein
MVTPFKKPVANRPDCKLFNATLSSRRIVIEHVFGILKSRFPAITSVPVRIKDVQTHKDVVDWFESACIIHNFLLLEQDTDWEIAVGVDTVADLGEHDGEEQMERSLLDAETDKRQEFLKYITQTACI